MSKRPVVCSNALGRGGSRGEGAPLPVEEEWKVKGVGLQQQVRGCPQMQVGDWARQGGNWPPTMLL